MQRQEMIRGADWRTVADPILRINGKHREAIVCLVESQTAVRLQQSEDEIKYTQQAQLPPTDDIICVTNENFIAYLGSIRSQTRILKEEQLIFSHDSMRHRVTDKRLRIQFWSGAVGDVDRHQAQLLGQHGQNTVNVTTIIKGSYLQPCGKKRINQALEQA
ncbi:Hypothetical predicted protein, partial [Scomber scombrus]